MSDIALNWSDVAADFSIVGNDLEVDNGLETSVLLSLFTDKALPEGTPLPAGVANRGGWWGDGLPFVEGDQFGSHLWLLQREKQQQVVLSRGRQYATEALQWMLDDGVAAAVDVTASVPSRGVLGLAIVIRRPPLAPLTLRRYDYIWAAQALRRP